MAVNKVIYGGQTLIDITDSTVTAENIPEGVIAYRANGERIVGTMVLYKRNIGEIIQSAIPLTDAGLHLLDGSLLPSGGVYAQFVQHINGLQASYPDLFVTQAEFDSSVGAYGSCGKFVVTSSGVRLPKVSDILQGTTDLSAVGDLVEAGLPNILGYFGSVVDGNKEASPIASGAFKDAGTIGSKTYGASLSNETWWRGTNFKASLSSSIYKDNFNTVQPQTIKSLLYICVATAVKTQIQADIDNIATDLNGKADKDLSNATAPVLSAPYVVEEWHLYTGWYRVWSTGFIEQGGRITVNGSSQKVNFFKPFSNTDYNLTNANYYNAVPDGTHLLCFGNLTTSGFTRYGSPSWTGTFWYACGF